MRNISIIFFFCTIACTSFAQGGDKSAKSVPGSKETSQFSKTNLTYRIILAPHNTWCYDVYSNGKRIIHQPSVPGMSGDEGFKSKERAEKVARLVVGKIRKGQMPPTVEILEMKKLKAI